MNPKKRAALEAAGFRVGTVQQFLGLSDAESKLVELRVAIAKKIKGLRTHQGASQGEIAAKFKKTQPQMARIEAAKEGVSLDQMFLGLFAAGGSIADLVPLASRQAKPRIAADPVQRKPVQKRTMNAKQVKKKTGGLI